MCMILTWILRDPPQSQYLGLAVKPGKIQPTNKRSGRQESNVEKTSSGIGSRRNGRGDGRRASEWVMCQSRSIRIDLSAAGGLHLGSILPSSGVDVEGEKTKKTNERSKKGDRRDGDGEMDRKKNRSTERRTK